MRIPWIYVNPNITLMMSLKWKRVSDDHDVNRDRARQYENTEIIITRGHRIYYACTLGRLLCCDQAAPSFRFLIQGCSSTYSSTITYLIDLLRKFTPWHLLRPFSTWNTSQSNLPAKVERDRDTLQANNGQSRL